MNESEWNDETGRKARMEEFEESLSQGARTIDLRRFNWFQAYGPCWVVVYRNTLLGTFPTQDEAVAIEPAYGSLISHIDVAAPDLVVASIRGDLAMVQDLLPFASQEDLDQSLAFACFDGHLEVVKCLIDHGANVHSNQERPLIWACDQGHLKIVKWLVENKSASSTANEEAPLRWAIINGHLPVVDYLIQRGSNLAIHDHEPLRLASKYKHTAIESLIRAN
jgi:hypothetical protein